MAKLALAIAGDNIVPELVGFEGVDMTAPVETPGLSSDERGRFADAIGDWAFA
jgi:hypothetical protein